MTPSAFARLYEASADSARLEAAYDNVLSHLFQNPFWKTGPTVLRRVLWNRGRRAQTEDSETFKSPGLYLWGVEDRPLYVGITRGSFSKRFSRYIWSERSQCNLAQEFEATLISKGIDGFPPEITDSYARNFRSSKVRFALFPHATVAEIRALEQALIPVAEKWNNRRGLLPLLNKQK